MEEESVLEVLVVLQECFRTKYEVAHKLVAATSAKLSGSLRMAFSDPNIKKKNTLNGL